MALKPVASRRVQTGSFQGEQMQRTAQQAAQLGNVLKKQLDQLVVFGSSQDWRTTSASLQATPLSFFAKAGDCWFVEAWVNASNSGANGMVFGVEGPPGTTVSGWLESNTSSTAWANWFTQAITAIHTASIACYAGAANTARPTRIQARLEVVNDGPITIQAASVTAGTTSTVYRQSLLRATKYLRV